MDDLYFLTMRIWWAFPSVREFRIPFSPDFHTKCSANFVSVVDELSRRLVREGLLERGDIRFDYNFDTRVLVVFIPNRHLFPCSIDDDDPDQFNCYFGVPMKPYRTMVEGVGATLYASLQLLQALSERPGLKIHASNLHPDIGEILKTFQWPGGGQWVRNTEDDEDWFVRQD